MLARRGSGGFYGGSIPRRAPSGAARKGVLIAHTYTKLIFHCIFGTKERRPLLSGEIDDKTNAYMFGIARNHNMHLVRAGGAEDHRHLILELKPAMGVPEALRLIKTNSSKWMRETFPQLHGWGWQEGYSAFSVSESALPKVIEYVDRQAEHHRRMSFEEELKALLDRHGVEYDPTAVLD